MNAFYLFDLHEAFDLNQEDLERRYLSLSLQYHPDTVAQGSTREKLEATLKTADLNEAYETLKNPLTRGYHLLSLKNPESTADQEQTIKDPALLMEALEDRETLEDASTSALIKTLIQETDRKKSKTLQDIQIIFENNILDQAPLALYRYRYYDKFLQDAQLKLDRHALTD